MKIRYFILAVLVGASVGCVNGTEKKAEVSSNPATRIGVYDSRAVAIAYGNTELFKKEMKKMTDDYEAAKKKNDPAEIKRCEEAFKAGQDRLHRQGFSTAPVDNIMAQIPESIAAIQKESNVIALVSKWDAKKLAEYPNAEKVDVTESLMQALHPTEKQLKYARDIQTREPVPLDQIDEVMKTEKKQ